jgi:chaperonin GroES
MSKLNPVNGYIVIKPIEEEEQLYGNIVIPDLGKEKPEMGEVVATSDTYNFNSDRFVPSQLSIGDKVLIPKLGSVRITVEGEEYYITKEQDIYAKFTSEEPKVNVLDVLKETVVDKDFEKYNNKVL